MSDIKSGKSEFPYIQETIIPDPLLNKLSYKIMNCEEAEIEGRDNSLEEFKYLLDDLWDLLGEENLIEKINELEEMIEDGYTILSAVMLDDTVYLVSKYEESPNLISTQSLINLLQEVKNYCETTRTVQFPPEWDNVVSILQKPIEEQNEKPIFTKTTISLQPIDYKRVKVEKLNQLKIALI